MTEFLAGIPGPLALIAAMAVLFAESGLLIGVFLPGTGTVLAIGLLAGGGVVEVWLAAVCASTATALGCQHSFYRGRRGGLLRREMVKRLGEQRVARLESSLDGRAEVTVAVSQCFAAVRTLVPRLAARTEMSHLRFTLCNLPVAIAWATTLVLLGAWSGDAYDRVETIAGLAGLPVLLLAAAVAVTIWWLRRKNRLRA
ncbi:membrane-associated protein [Saccharopolyspora antimicrobica]|uniref:Membrane-associated protein n=1 Tax=Saccharopolyspora antimicrobica TaxID=455193 RepID=A0A1I5DF31_9PSEU|nr:VTT domain-containing protein [Saccharopolyspora antimicrobica]RKT85140.1 membrane-associated protein [Saccharopolyspora antimicrobica]SFN97800.1 membrane-associated protein [Saccharopolyspora antimicrobica]